MLNVDQEKTLFKPRITTIDLKKEAKYLNQEVSLKGWVRTLRVQKAFSFLEVNDGSELSNMQVLLDQSLPNYTTLIESIQTGASVSVKGLLQKSPGGLQNVEIQATEVLLIGPSPSDYVLQKKRHSFEFLRTIAHLRPRTNTMGCVVRVRNALAAATHDFFQSLGFYYLHTPIITASDCEGAGELFQITTLDLNHLPKTKEGLVDTTQDFFGKPAYLTVSGQLNLEAYCLALGNVYTFGPTFRAENSNTSRHLAEFWMIEPEIAFADLTDDMNLAEDYLKHLLRHVLENNLTDLEFFDQFIQKGLIDRLTNVLTAKVERVSYTEAIAILQKSGKNFEYPVKWGIDLQSEHERFLAEVHFSSPLIVYNYPKEIKSFYMRRNDDGKTVAAMDFLVPGIGELMGGSQREDRVDMLTQAIVGAGLDLKTYDWYLDLRRFGSVPHAGFGLGFDRLVQYVTGMENIRDTIPFPRTPGHAEF